jgi:hypothetical protein
MLLSKATVLILVFRSSVILGSICFNIPKGTNAWVLLKNKGNVKPLVSIWTSLTFSSAVKQETQLPSHCLHVLAVLCEAALFPSCELNVCISLPHESKIGPCHVAQVVRRRPLTAEARVGAWVIPCGICGEQSFTGTGLSRSSPVLPCQYHSTVILHSHLSPGGWTIGPLMVAVQRLGLTPSTWTTSKCTIHFHLTKHDVPAMTQ